MKTIVYVATYANESSNRNLIILMWKKRSEQTEYKNENDTIWNSFMYESENDEGTSMHKTKTLYEIQIITRNFFAFFEIKNAIISDKQEEILI